MARRSPSPLQRLLEPPWSYVAAGAAGLGVVLIARAVGAFGFTGHLPGTLFTIVIENRSASEVLVPNGPMPYLASLAREYAQATNFRSTLRPSEPNYLRMMAGRDFGVRDDRPHTLETDALLFAQFDAAGIPWGVYSESAGGPCQLTDRGAYARRHNPAVDFAYVTGRPNYCVAHLRTLEDLWPVLAADAVRFAWVGANEQHNGHDGSLAQSDAWLAVTIPRLMASPGYRKGGAIVITSDEPGFGANIADRSRLPFVLVSPFAKRGGTDGTPFSHEGYLAMVEDLLGLPRLPATAGKQWPRGLFA